VHVRHCPHCQEDYRPEIVRCADCGELLEDRDDDAAAGEDNRTRPDRDEGDTPQGFEPIHTSRHLGDLPPLADSLVAAGIECRIREVRRDMRVVGYGLLVRSEDRSAATVALQSLVAPTVAETFNPERGYSHCPACETALPPNASDCPDCGLPLASAAGTCPECGTITDASAECCGNCGHALGGPD
jgi:hypothetical protein